MSIGERVPTPPNNIDTSDLVARIELETQHMTRSERHKILSVINRDDTLRQTQRDQITRLKLELAALRRRGAITCDSSGSSGTRTCSRCRTTLGWLFNRGAECRACRERVCKGCRSAVGAPWICRVCLKEMEIQSFSGEWMNEFVRRPSRRRDNRIYVPPTDLIKRSLRRSWTISSSSHTPQNQRCRQLRPYNSLPRHITASDFPILATYQTKAEANTNETCTTNNNNNNTMVDKGEPSTKKLIIAEPVAAQHAPPRINPLTKFAESRKVLGLSACDTSSSESEIGESSKAQPASGGSEQEQVVKESCKKSTETVAAAAAAVVSDVEVEALTGYVFRRISKYKKRSNTNEPIGRRRGAAESELLDVLLPEGDDYKLVFISSDGSSKEEDPDDNDSSSTASSFPIDECDWDYFEPRLYRRLDSPRLDSPDYLGKRDADEMDLLRCVHQVPETKQPCQSCGAPMQFVPVPVPVPVPMHWNPEDALVEYSAETMEALRAQLRVLPRALWPFLNHAAVMINSTEANPFLSALKNSAAGTGGTSSTPAASEQNSRTEQEQTDVNPSATDDDENNMKIDGCLQSEFRDVSDSSSDSSGSELDYGKGESKCSGSYDVCANDFGYAESNDEIDYFESSSDDSDSNSSASERVKRKRKRVYVVNRNESSSETDDDASDQIVLTRINPLHEDDERNSVINEDHCDNASDCDRTSSPGLSAVSAESLRSSVGDDDDGVALGGIRAGDDDAEEVGTAGPVSEQAGGGGASVVGEPPVSDCGLAARHATARYTSLVMITQDTAPAYAPVSVVTSDTTTVVRDNDVVVRHTNWQDGMDKKVRKQRTSDENGMAEYFTLTLENSPVCAGSPKQPVVTKNVIAPKTEPPDDAENVTVITGADTLSAVVCLEEGLADDDSWVENLSHDEDDFNTNDDDSSSSEEVTLHCTAIDHEEELRGYNRSAIDYRLHTILEESCEDSEVEQPATSRKTRPTSATDLEKYFYFSLGEGTGNNINQEDAFSETSSICSESLDSLADAEEMNCNENTDPADLASSRLEKYFLTGFTSFKAERRDSDGSVGSDSEGRPSPEQRRKRLVRARGTGRSHSSSLDNLISNPDLSSTEQNGEVINSEISSSSDTDTYDEATSFEKNDGQFDTVKRKKNKKQKPSTANGNNSPAEETKTLEITQEECHSDDEGNKTPQPPDTPFNSDFNNRNKQQSRDSGFVGSSDDLIKDVITIATTTKPESPSSNAHVQEEKLPPATSLTRKDSFNNWSSDEETNLMMCKMRQFFKTMVANNNNSKPTTPIMGSPKTPKLKNRCKPPQLVYFENELTRLMKTVPGIRDDQVREIVEYLSSEDTWSDSYDSSDYTSSDLEGATVCNKSALQKQISDSCKQIINKFDTTVEDEEGDEGDGGIMDDSHNLNPETAFVYQKLVASLEKMTTGENTNEKLTTPHNSPPLIAKVMHHIGSRLVALMHEVSSGENTPKCRNYHKTHKLSSTSTTTEDEDSHSDNALSTYSILQRSKSHDILTTETRTLNQSNNTVSDIVEEKEASDCERFSWRGSFESALLATDSRNKLSLIGGEGSASASALAIAAKRRSAGDLLFTHKSLSREQLDRVRSCGSIGGASSEDKLWIASATRSSRRRSSVPDASCGSAEDEEERERGSTLPRSLQSGVGTTNSLPRLPTNNASSSTGMQKAQSMYHFLQQNVKSARYRPPGLSRLITSVPKRAVSAPGLQPVPQRRNRRQQNNASSDDISVQSQESLSSPMLKPRVPKCGSPSPLSRSRVNRNEDWHLNEELDRLSSHPGSMSNLGSRSDSMASVYSGAGEGRYGSVVVKGQVEFGLQYNYKTLSFEINIKQCRDLAAVDSKRNRSDPYVKVYLLPDKTKSGKRKTKVKKHTLNPVFDETLRFAISLGTLETRTLWLTVCNSDMFGRNDFLGEVMMPLNNKVFDDPTPKWYQLQERTESFEDTQTFRGHILVGLKYVPPDMTAVKKGKRFRGSLQVLVKEAKNLPAVKANGTSDSFCKSYLLPDKGRSGKQKTHVVRKTVNPIWNHSFVYDDVTLQELAERSLELTVWDHDRLASNEFLGGVRFSLGTGKHYGRQVEWMDSEGKELSVWKSMLERPNFWVEGCVSLRPSLELRTS